MYLSLLRPNPRLEKVRLDLEDCRRLHRRIMSCFPLLEGGGEARKRLGVLYRVEEDPGAGDPLILVQSFLAPDWIRLPPGWLQSGIGLNGPACERMDYLYDNLSHGIKLLFRLRASPTRKVRPTGQWAGRKACGRRVELRGLRGQVDWLCRKGDQGGFRVLSVAVEPDYKDTLGARQAASGTQEELARPENASFQALPVMFLPVLFQGRLEVTDVEVFREYTLKQGIGPGKAYGNGLMSIAPDDEDDDEDED